MDEEFDSFLARPIVRQMLIAILLAFIALRIIPGTREISQWFPTAIAAACATSAGVLLYHLRTRPRLAATLLRDVRGLRSWRLLLVTAPLAGFAIGGGALLQLLVRSAPSIAPRPSPLLSAGPPLPGWAGWSVAAIVAVIVAPVIEEIFFRVLAYQRSVRRWGPMRGALVTSALFAILHANWVATFVFSLVMIVIMHRSGSLWLPILAHALFNMVAVAMTVIGGQQLSITNFTAGSAMLASPGTALVLLCAGAGGLVLFWYTILDARPIRELLQPPVDLAR